MQSPARDPEIPRLHADYVRALARSLVFDDALADDVAQDVWVAALEHGPRDKSSLRAWLAARAEARSGPLAPGPHVLRIQASLDPPIAGATVPFEIAVGQETRLDLVLRAGKRVTIAIHDPSKAASDVRAFVTTKDGTYIGFSMLDKTSDDRFEAAFRLLDGEYGVRALAKDGRKAEGTILVGADGKDTFELELKSP